MSGDAMSTERIAEISDVATECGAGYWHAEEAFEAQKMMQELLDHIDALLAENARLLARVGDLESVGAALEDAGNRLYAYIIKSNASGKEGKSAFFDVLEDGLQASRDFHDAQKQWQALAAHAAGAGDDGEGKDG